MIASYLSVLAIVARLERTADLEVTVVTQVRIDVLAVDRRELAAIVRPCLIDAAVVVSRFGAHQKHSKTANIAVVEPFNQPTECPSGERRGFA